MPLPPSPRRRFLKRLALTAVSLLSLPFLLEGVLRLLDPWGAGFKVPMWRFASEAKRLHPNPRRSWSFQPGFQGDYGVPVRLNRGGFRGPDWPAPGQDRRILVLGDSYTFGYAVREEEVFSSILEGRLGSPFRILNAGGIGYNTTQEREILKEDGFPARPETVLVLMVGNDWEPIQGGSATTQAKAAHEAWCREHPVRARIAFGPFGCFPYTCLYLYHGLQWKWRLFDDVPRIGMPWELFSEADEGWRDCREALSGMQQDCREKGIRFGVLLHEDYPPVRAFLQRQGIPHQVLFPSYAEAAKFALCPIDSHPNPEGHRRIAEGFHGLLREHGWLEPPRH